MCHDRTGQFPDLFGSQSAGALQSFSGQVLNPRRSYRCWRTGRSRFSYHSMTPMVEDQWKSRTKKPDFCGGSDQYTGTAVLASA
jgi:hypothetical protein